MTHQHDVESRKRQLTRDSMPAKSGSVRRLMERVEALEKRDHWHCGTCGGMSYAHDGETIAQHDADCPELT